MRIVVLSHIECILAQLFDIGCLRASCKFNILREAADSKLERTTATINILFNTTITSPGWSYSHTMTSIASSLANILPAPKHNSDEPEKANTKPTARILGGGEESQLVLKVSLFYIKSL